MGRNENIIKITNRGRFKFSSVEKRTDICDLGDSSAEVYSKCGRQIMLLDYLLSLSNRLHRLGGTCVSG